ncbi:tRNA (adenine(58)-N(1))-methyltransferase catalytic subunit TRMT61A [Hyposmocoma kahamanoa]|uniref:tRNA (adenine(58)-N(1))-methyltransferase catalytic subunit TRMT61A n=1 Tax=Hyposmocoma kahamanoa TaxID=1477025 RepID=UPI000E6D7E8B|nr:tRNA (adenine(58)-N(1))-methyltransferase catalytic subunit TRMT61A [Hyposmocoma kahamanoa]
MSLSGYKQFIEPNDTVILYLCNNLHAVLVQEKIRNKNGILVENVYQTPFGALKVKDLIGVQYGSKVELSKGWGHVIQPTPELWTLCLPHRTQIIYSPDISMILCQLDLIPGKVVVEAGTGSGSLTHAFIRCVKPKGFVFTFDFHPQRAQFAQKEFELHGVDQFVSVKCRDVLTCGFGEELNSQADAVFLDLPKPWLGISWAKHAIRYDKEVMT